MGVGRRRDQASKKRRCEPRGDETCENKDWETLLRRLSLLHCTEPPVECEDDSECFNFRRTAFESEKSDDTAVGAKISDTSNIHRRKCFLSFTCMYNQ